MNCSEYEGWLVELARGGTLNPGEREALLTHLEHCMECSRRLEEQQALEAALKRISGEELRGAESIEAQVLAEFDRAATLHPPATFARWALTAALAASLVLAAASALRTSPVAVQPSAVSSASSRRATSLDTPFVTIPYTIPLAPEERAEVVRMRIPVTILLAVGFHVDATDLSSSIDADVLVSQDGRARAIRPLSVLVSD